nr:MAG TPA: LTXXQ motif family protein [Caudoviricetes sp.]
MKNVVTVTNGANQNTINSNRKIAATVKQGNLCLQGFGLTEAQKAAVREVVSRFK